VRDDFLATVSHDLRTLLGGMVINAEVLSLTAAEGPAGDRARKHAQVELRLTTQMNRLINDLLDVVSIDAGQLSVVRDRVDVAPIVQHTVDAFAALAASAQVSLDGPAQQ